jgi:hypothetical protein
MDNSTSQDPAQPAKEIKIVKPDERKGFVPPRTIHVRNPPTQEKPPQREETRKEK